MHYNKLKVGNVYKYKDDRIEKDLVFVGYVNVDSYIKKPFSVDEIVRYYYSMLSESKDELKNRFHVWMLRNAVFVRVECLEQPFQLDFLHNYPFDALDKHFYETKEQMDVKAWLVKSQMLNEKVPRLSDELEVKIIINELCDYYTTIFDKLGREALITRAYQRVLM